MFRLQAAKASAAHGVPLRQDSTPAGSLGRF
jgi:hypothetical protein